ncbi:DUF2256 domain-containing protein [Pseudomonas fluorescens]|uniref:DUF2256 domain-containing protein n=1 Tax=Pseudomonas fluorescens TaxID=294 RepID=UPI003C6DF14F
MVAQAIGRWGVAVKKSELPIKTCATCGLPFTWRDVRWIISRRHSRPFFRHLHVRCSKYLVARSSSVLLHL